MPPDDTVYVHLHVPKCAGTSLNKLMKRRFGDRVLTGDDPAKVAAFEAMSNAERDAAYDCVAGHFPWGVHEKFGRPVRTFSVVREPVSRVCSYFNFLHLWRQHPSHEMMARTLTDLSDLTPEWLRGRPGLRQQWSNFACRAYAGRGVNADTYGAAERQVVDAMRDGRLVVGPLQLVVDWLREEGVIGPDDAPGHDNRSCDHPVTSAFVWASPETLSPRAHALIARRNRLDAALLEAIGWTNFVLGRAERPADAGVVEGAQRREAA